MDWILDIEHQAKQIVNMLPDDEWDAFTCISIAIDLYAYKHGHPSSKVWQCLYDVAMAVHKEHGDYDNGLS